MTEREYQTKIQDLLRKIYEQVEIQWYPFRGHGRHIYSPAVDVAVGPFAIEMRLENRYTELLNETKDFITSLILMHNQNVASYEEQTSFDSLLHFNENARCLLCIEVEDKGGRKHCIGNLVNASALGRIGILVARSNEAFRVFLRQRVYLKFLAGVGKNTFKTDNALVLTSEQFDSCLTNIGRHQL